VPTLSAPVRELPEGALGNQQDDENAASAMTDLRREMNLLGLSSAGGKSTLLRRLHAHNTYLHAQHMYGQHDHVMARELFQYAAEQGHTFAQFAFARMLELGEGGLQDAVSAREWYAAAAARRLAHAERELARLAHDHSLLVRSTHDHVFIQPDMSDIPHGCVLACSFVVYPICRHVWHWAIYDRERASVIELTGKQGLAGRLRGNALVRRRSLASLVSEYGSGRIMQVVWKDGAMRRAGAWAVERARERIGEKPLYAVSPKVHGNRNNCESWVRECFDGVAGVSSQAQRYEHSGLAGGLMTAVGRLIGA
jgi:hypothetical protein